jgi:ATP-dependent DNA helicase RecG
MKNEFIETILNIPEESQTLEFKRVTSSGVVKDILETIVAMANTDGGVIVLGIDDPEKTNLKGVDRVFGIEEDKDRFDEIGREISKIIPPLSHIWPPSIEFVEEISKSIALIKIPKVIDCFRSINNHVFLRQLKSNKLLTPQEVIDLSYAKGFQKADKELVDVDFRLLDTIYYQEWLNKRGVKGENIQTILEKVGLAIKDKGGKLHPTRAAVLLFAEYPTNLLDTKCTIRVMQYSGTIETLVEEAPNLLGKPKTIEGPVIKLIKDTHDYVLNLLQTGIQVPSGFVTKYKIPERTVKEAITNAVIHRDYYIKRDIEVKIFEDRVEIENPGLFAYNITPANIGFVRASGYRNDLLVKHLREFSAPPNLDQNEGVRTMRGQMYGNNLYPPIFWTYPNLQDAIRVVLFNEIRATEWEKVSGCLEKNKYINNEQARGLTSIKDRDKMTQLLKKWVKQGLLIQIIPSTGYLKGTKYRLPNTADLTRNDKNL